MKKAAAKRTSTEKHLSSVCSCITACYGVNVCIRFINMLVDVSYGTVMVI